MIDSDFELFAEIWAEVHEFMPGGKKLSHRAITMIFEAMSDYTLDAIEKALSIHIQCNKFAPTPSDIIEILSSSKNKHVGADEAWAIALASFDEFDTVVINQQITEARSIAYDVWESGDKVGARMAFKAAYDRIIQSSPVPSWFVSIGYDTQRRVDAVKKAVSLGRISQECANKHLPPPELTTTVAGLIESAHKHGYTISPVEALSIIKTNIESAEDRERERKQADREAAAAKQQEFENRRQEALAKVAERLCLEQV